ncbi:MAG TPA: histidine kinase dimerization/phosphoacceptor domain -containing protein [Pseudolabrys sp.]|jgi:two-component sensor histidine kinase
MGNRLAGVRSPSVFRKQFTDARDACALAEGIVDTVREPVLVLDHELRVIAANRSFYSAFKVVPKGTQGKLLYRLGGGQWDIPALRVLLEKILPEHSVMENYEVEHDFPDIGQRIMLLNARKIFHETGSHATILLGIEDITKKRAVERELDELVRQKDIMLDEMQHRVANSLQIIASIIMMKAKSVNSEEMRRHLQDAHQRVLSVAAVQQHLHAAAPGATVQLGPYLTKLCDALSRSMIGDNRSISLKVCGEDGSASCRDAESLGLVVTELIINSLKHGFNDDTKDGQISVAFEVSGTDWKLTVVDNGVGKPDGVFAQPKTGLGTAIINALAKQLDAKVVTLSGAKGTTVSVTHATFTTKAAKVA